MDVSGGIASDGRNIQAYSKNGTASQKFKLELVAPVISMERSNYHVGENVTVEFGDITNLTAYDYYLAEFPAGFASLSGSEAWSSKTFTELGSGHYTIFTEARNSKFRSGQSNWLSFDVCEKEYVPVAQKTYNGHSYAVYDYEMSWTFARDLCQQMNGHLVTITDADECAFVNELIAEGNKAAYWIGAGNYSSSSPNQDGVWSWVTGEEFSYTNWKSGEPSASGTGAYREHWAEIRKSYSNQWNDVNNTSKNNKGFVFEIDFCDAERYHVEFLSNGGNGSIASQTVPEGSCLILPACTFTAPDGKQFKAWSISGMEYVAGASYIITGNTTIIALWEDIPITAQIISVSPASTGTNALISCSDGNASVICAAYDSYGKMVGVEIQPVAIGEQTYSFPFTSSYSIKVFLLDEYYCPMCKCEVR